MTVLVNPRLAQIVADIRAKQDDARKFFTAHLRELGKLLTEAREIFRYDRNEGGFTGWVEANLHFSVSTVYRLIDVHTNLTEEQFSHVGNLALDAIYALAEPATHPEVRREIAERASSGETITAAEIRAKRTAEKQERREIREVELAAKQTALPQKRYGVIYADPPWRFEPYSRDTGMDRAADNHYPTQGVGEIASLPIGDIAADDCVLFMWATMPMLEAALAVVKAWGFTYKSNCVWVKETYGTGYWFRQQHEILLVATRGKVPAPAPGTQFPSIIMAKAGLHSEKPTRVYKIIEAYFPNLPKIELYARKKHGWAWDVWGNEAPEDSVADSIDGDGVAYADEEKPDATDFSDAEHQRPEPGERAAAESAQGEATGADPSTGGNGSEGHRGGGEAESEEPGPAGEGEDPFGGLNYDKPGFEAIPRGLLRDPENPLAKLGGGIA